MKLRNKKTGKIGEVAGVMRFIIYEANMPLCGNSILGQYDTLAELNAEWEDYTPKEPLIKDEKIRKAVRAWAEANSFENLKVSSDFKEYWGRYGLMMEFEHDIEWERADGYNTYTIDELCGEEE